MAASKEVFNTQKCKVLLYDETTKELDLDFNGFGIRINGVDKCDSEFITIKYKGEIGTSNFTCKLA